LSQHPVACITVTYFDKFNNPFPHTRQ